jgi:hypothetical protein
MKNDQEILAAIDRKDGWLNEVRSELARESRGEAEADTRAIVSEAFLRTVSRPPTAAESERIASHLDQLDDPVEGLRDLLWVLLNMREFVTNH